MITIYFGGTGDGGGDGGTSSCSLVPKRMSHLVVTRTDDFCRPPIKAMLGLRAWAC